MKVKSACAGPNPRSTGGGATLGCDLGIPTGSPAIPRVRVTGSSGWPVVMLAGALAGVLAWSCGGQTDGSPGGTSGASGASGSGGGATDGGGAGGRAGAGGAGGVAGGGAAGQGGTGGLGWTDCTTPDIAFCGYAECQSCPDDADCAAADQPWIAPMDLCVAVGDFDWNYDLTGFAPRDGRALYAYWLPAEPSCGSFMSMPFSGAQLLAKRGFASHVAYADRGRWTGEPLPEPAECPEVEGLRLCGGRCGDCATDELCTGRSPLHPWGFCVPANDSFVRDCSLTPACAKAPCSTGRKCFVYTVEPSQQPVADTHGVCLPQELCEAAAAGLPGGGRCE